MDLNSLEDVMAEQLKDIYSAETQLTKSLPRMAKVACSPSLKDALQRHLEETAHQVERLQKIAKMLEVALGGHKCSGMQGLIEECETILESDGDKCARDAAIIAAAQRVEHYEIAAYGTARAFARKLGYKEVASLLERSLQEEAAADKNLTQICEDELLPQLMGELDTDEEIDNSEDDEPAMPR